MQPAIRVFTFALSLCSAILLAGEPAAPKPLSQSQALTLAKKVLAETDPAKKEALLKDAPDGPASGADIPSFVKLLQPAGFAPVKPGVQHKLQLQVPESVHSKPVEYSLSVPSKYAPTKLYPLVIGLHGGGENLGSGDDHMKSNAEVRASDCIFVCPTSVDLTVKLYWRNPKNETMLALLIQQMMKQFPIDPDRVYLTGYSMGGIAAYYLAPRMSDRFAGVAPGGGAWHGVYWPSMLNTPVYIYHGKNDMRGKQFTDFPNAQNAAECLKENGCPYELRAMDCGHGNLPPGEEKKMVDWLLLKKRNPYPKRIVMASPRAKDYASAPLPAPPDRWLIIDEIGTDTLEMDGVAAGGTPRMKHKMKMGTVDATWTAQNVLEIKTQNVRKLRVLLSPALLDIKKPLKISVDGKTLHDAVAPTSYKFLIKYLDERRDPGMAFIGEVALDLTQAPSNASADPRKTQ